MKKCIISVLIICVLFNLLTPAIYAYSEAFPVWSEAAPTFAKIENKVNLNLSVESAVLMEEDTGTILYTKNEHTKLRPASVTKIMTLLLIMEALDSGKINLNDKVPCSAKANSMGGSQIWLDQTEELTVHEMLKAICVVSANDCTVAMAEFLSGSEEAFVEKMNARAKELGMNDTMYKNSHGIDEEGHLTSAYDIAILSRELSKSHPQIHEYTKIWMDTLRDGKSQLVNTNKLIRFYSGCTGLKTGSTSLAGFNLAATATRNELKLIAVVMKGETSQKRFDDAKTLLDYGFANYYSRQLCTRGDVVEKIYIEKSKNADAEIIIGEDKHILLDRGSGSDIAVENIFVENISAPLEYNEKVGEAVYKLNNEEIARVDLITKEKVERKGVIDFNNEAVDLWFTLGRRK